MSKQKRIRKISPRGVAVYPKLNEPDTKYKAEGEYAVKLAYDPKDAEVAKFVEELEEIQQEFYAEFVKGKPANKKFKLAPVFTEEVDNDTGEETGRILINFKMKASGVSKKTQKPWSRKPVIIDAQKRVMKNPPNIGGGSILRIGFEPVPGPVQSSKLFYISCRLEVAQLIELREFGTDVNSFGFDEEDGYEADAATLRGVAAGVPEAADEDEDDEGEDGDF